MGRYGGGLLIVGAMAGTSVADPRPDAAVLAQQAETRATAGDYLGAAMRFRDAFLADPRPEYVCNVGVALYKAKDFPRAELYLRRCEVAGSGLPRDFRNRLRDVLAAVASKLKTGGFTPLELSIRPEASIITVASFDEPDRLSGTDRLWVARGTYRLEARAQGYVTRTVEVVAGSADVQRIEAVLEPAPEVKVPVPVPVPAPVVDRAAKPPPKHAITTRSRTPMWIVGGLSVAVGALAIGSFVHARSLADDAGRLTIEKGYATKATAARRWQKISWGTTGGAAVGLVIAGYLWRRSSTPITVTPVDRGATVSWIGVLR